MNSVSHVKSLVLQNFVVSEQVAQEIAEGLTLLQREWGDSKKEMDWEYTIQKHGVGKYDWRSEKKKQEFENRRKMVTEGYNAIITSKENSFPRF